MHRRDALKALTGSFIAALSGTASGSTAPSTKKVTGLGLVAYCSRYRRAWLKANNKGFDLYRPENYLAHCRQLGAGGVAETASVS